jgi:hypothetical protein
MRPAEVGLNPQASSKLVRSGSRSFQLTKEHMWAKEIATMLVRLLLDGLPSPHVPF